jgi:hypothetical protein
MLRPGVLATAARYDSGICDGGSRPVYEGNLYRPNRTITAMAGARRLAREQRNAVTMTVTVSDPSIERGKRKRDTTDERLGGGGVVCTSNAERWRIGR